MRRIGAVALSGAVLASMLSVGPAASADTPEAFKGTASAWALKAKVLNLVDLTAGATNATGDSTPNAQANGAGLAGLPILAQSVSKAEALGVGRTSTPDKACVADLPVEKILHLSVACALSAASTMNGPNASSSSSVVGLNVQLLNLVLTLLKPITDVLVPVLDQTIGSVTGTLQPVLGGLLSTLNLGSLGLDLKKPVSSLLTTLEKLTELASVSVLPSTSVITTVAGTTTAAATAKGAEIVVLPGLTVLGHALLKIHVLAATAIASFDRTTGISSAHVDPAIVTVQLLDAAPISVGLGAPLVLLAGTPLQSTISLGAGEAKPTADGATAVADGLSVHLLSGISGGINIDLAHAEAAITGATATKSPASTTTTAAPLVTPPAEVHTGRLLLATTGTNLPLLPIGFVLILAGYLTRRRLVRR